MNELYPYGLPGEHYLNVIKEGYASAGFDTAVLDEAARASEPKKRSEAKNCTLCGGAMVWAHPDLPGRYMESSCNLEDWEICKECMVEHCCDTNCLGCSYGIYPDCRFLDMKRHYMNKD